jgi:hypothetical protein
MGSNPFLVEDLVLNSIFPLGNLAKEDMGPSCIWMNDFPKEYHISSP